MEKPKKKNCIKIIGGVVIAVILIVIIALLATSGMTKVIDEQLSAISKGDINTAYSLTSKGFQSETSLAQFKEFLQQSPALLNNKSSTFTNRTDENGLGTVEGKLVSKDGSITPVAYQLVKENGEWKIQGIKLNPGGIQTENQSDNSPVDVISAIKISDQVDSDGVVRNGKIIFSASTPELAVSAYITNGRVGDRVGAKLVYVNTGDETEPVANDIAQNGDLVSNFSFTKPISGWPVGNYKVIIATTEGGQVEQEFQVK